MNIAEFHKYWKPARDLVEDPDIELTFFPLRRMAKSQYLCRLLGIDAYHALKEADWSRIVLTDTLKHQLRMLAGPHRRAIIKMLQIRKAENEETETTT